MTPTVQYIVSVVAAIAAIVIGILGVTNPPILNLPVAPVIFIIGGFAILGVPLSTGLAAARANTAGK